MTTAVVALSVACALLALACTVLGACVPFLWHRLQRLEAAVDRLDEVLAETLEAAGVKRGPAGNMAEVRK